MSAFMHDVARASLPVAIALLAFTAVARAALWADDPAVVRVGRQYLEPLSIWCLGAVGVQLFARGRGGRGRRALAAPPDRHGRRRRAAAAVGGGREPAARQAGRAEEARGGPRPARRPPLRARPRPPPRARARLPLGQARR